MNGHAAAPLMSSRTPAALAADIDRSLSMCSLSEDDCSGYPTVNSGGWPHGGGIGPPADQR